MVKLNTKNINNHHKAGQSLIELIVAITIGGILLGVATVAVVLILRVNSDTRATQVAVSLAQEYLDNISALSESAWDNIYGLNKGSSYLYSIKNLYLSQISGGAWHTCGLKTDKTAYCWGSNGFGQLGDNSIIDKLTPVQVLGVGGAGNLANVSQITSGGNHTCAITANGSAYCWGYNGFGQLGDNSTINRYTPVQVKGVGGAGNLANVSQIASRDNNTCAITTDGSAYCWGYNGFGQLGDNSTINRYTPVQVKGVGGAGNLANVSQITTGINHTCAVKTDGLAYCWGFNGFGQLGDNSTVDKLTPVQVLNLVGISRIINVAGISYSCAITTSGSAYCWGSNAAGQLGDNSIIDKLTPVQVLGVGGVGNLANVSQISGGAFHTCAIITSGLAYCWGGNGNGQLGDGTTNGALTPVRILDVGGSSYINLNPTAFVKKIMTGSEGLSADGRSFTRYFFIENVNRTSCGVGDITSGSPLNCPINFPGGSNDIAEDPSTQKITINVEWQNNSSLSKTKYITRHRNLILNQSDWSGGPGQIYFSTTTFGAIVNNKFNSSNSMSYSNPGSLETSAPIGSSGELESSIFDSNSISAVNSIMWQGTLNNGNVKFQIASSNNSNGPWDYKGPDGTISTFYSAGSDIPNKINLAYHNNQRYFKYKVSILNNGSTPVVNDIIINWSP